MAPIPFPLTTMPGTRPQESAGRLINARAEPLGEGARNAARRVRVPGLASFATSSQTGFRGQIVVATILYAAFSGKVYRTTSAGGAMVLVGDLAGTRPVFFARNNRTPTPDTVVVSENGAFLVSSGVGGRSRRSRPAAAQCRLLHGRLFLLHDRGRPLLRLRHQRHHHRRHAFRHRRGQARRAHPPGRLRHHAVSLPAPTRSRPGPTPRTRPDFLSRARP